MKAKKHALYRVCAHAREKTEGKIADAETLSSAVALPVAAVGRREGKGIRIVVSAKTQVEPRIEELLCQGRFASKSVDGPLPPRAVALVGFEDEVEGPHHMEGHRTLKILGEGNLRIEHCPLSLDVGTAQTVEATFPDLLHLGVCQQSGKRFEIARQGEVGIGRPPRVNAGGIASTGLRHPVVGVLHNALRQANNACPGRCVEVVGVKV